MTKTQGTKYKVHAFRIDDSTWALWCAKHPNDATTAIRDLISKAVQ